MVVVVVVASVVGSWSSVVGRGRRSGRRSTRTRSARSIGLPSGSTISTCSSSHSRALRLRRSERTAGSWSLRSSGAGPCRRSAAPGRPGGDLGVEVLVGDLDALGLGDRPQGEVGLDRPGRRLPQLVDELLLGRGRWRRGTARASCPGPGAACARSWSRRSHLRPRPAPRARRPRPARRAPRRPSPEGHLGLEPLHVAQPAGEVVRSSSTVSNSDTSLAHSSSSLGEDLLLHLLDQDLERDGASPAGGSASKARMSPTLAPRQLVVELGADAAGADLVEVVVGREAGTGLAVLLAVDVDGHVVAVGGRPVDLGELGELLAQPVDLGVDLLVGGLGLTAPRPAGRRSRGRRCGAGPRRRRRRRRAVLLAGGDLDLGGAMTSTSCSRTAST